MQSSFAHKLFKRYAVSAAFLLTVTFASSAQVVPVPELQAAQQAVSRADEADAEQYAPDLLASAHRYLSAAQAAVLGSRSERRAAPALAARASADADLARLRSQDAVAQAALMQRRADVAELQQRLDGNGGGR